MHLDTIDINTVFWLKIGKQEMSDQILSVCTRILIYCCSRTGFILESVRLITALWKINWNYSKMFWKQKILCRMNYILQNGILQYQIEIASMIVVHREHTLWKRVSNRLAKQIWWGTGMVRICTQNIMIPMLFCMGIMVFWQEMESKSHPFMHFIFWNF